MESVYGFVYYLLASVGFIMCLLWLIDVELVIVPSKMWLHSIAAWLVCLCLYSLIMYWGYYLHYYEQSKEGIEAVGFHLDKTGFIASDSE